MTTTSALALKLPLPVVKKVANFLQLKYSGRITLHIQEGQIRKIETTEFEDITG